MAKARTLIIKSTDALGNVFEKALTSANPEATAQNIDTFCRAVTGLSKNTYQDTIIRDEESVTEILAE